MIWRRTIGWFSVFVGWYRDCLFLGDDTLPVEPCDLVTWSGLSLGWIASFAGFGFCSIQDVYRFE